MAQPLQRRRHQISAKLPRLAALAGKGRGNHNSTNCLRRSPWLKPTHNSDSAIIKAAVEIGKLRGRVIVLPNVLALLTREGTGLAVGPRCTIRIVISRFRYGAGGVRHEMGGAKMIRLDVMDGGGRRASSPT